MNPNFKKYLLDQTNSSTCKELEIIQSLWSGYGKISRYSLADSKHPTVVIKHINLGPVSNHPRGWNTDLGHQRKVKSYEIETNWYQLWGDQCPTSCKIPNMLGSYSEGPEQWIILEDLNPDFPLRKEQITIAEIKVCLQWLANFHCTFLNQKPEALWPIGTYWHLDTRPEEFEKIEHAELKAKASAIDQKLNEAKYQTIVHGDAKLANFCFSKDGLEVAAVDFQYVGGGCGMKDVAYFLGSCLSNSELEEHSASLLDYYFSAFKNALDASDYKFDYTELEQEWRSLYPMTCADFTRFLLGWMPSHQKLNSYQLKQLELVLSLI